MERAVQIQLVDFLNENSVLSQFQSGFRKKHSTETAIVYLSDRIIEHMDRQHLCGAAFIDCNKAFDLVDHKCLLHKLEHYGVRGNSLNWFKDHITTRMQRVKYDNKLSGSTEINYGVPQGSILGPLCFILYINDLPECLTKCDINLYADDTIIYYADKTAKEVEITLQTNIDKVSDWLEGNKLLLNQKKMKMILFGTKPKLNKVNMFSILLKGQEIESTRNQLEGK